LINDISGQIE